MIEADEVLVTSPVGKMIAAAPALVELLMTGNVGTVLEVLGAGGVGYVTAAEEVVETRRVGRMIAVAPMLVELVGNNGAVADVLGGGGVAYTMGADEVPEISPEGRIIAAGAVLVLLPGIGKGVAEGPSGPEPLGAGSPTPPAVDNDKVGKGNNRPGTLLTGRDVAGISELGELLEGTMRVVEDSRVL